MAQQKLSGMELDQIKEIVNIGASHASTALSQLVSGKVMITIPTALVDQIESNVEQMTLWGNKNELVTSVILKTLGDTPGIVALFLTKDSANRLANLVIKAETGEDAQHGDILTEFKYSALKEVGNISCGACLNALSKFLDMTIVQSVSDVATDMFQAIASSIMIEVGKDSGSALVFNVNLNIESEAIESKMFIFLSEESIAKILKVINVKMGM
jgi:chemotaxis protein CheC